MFNKYMLPCPKCTEENKRSFKELGYGYSYVGNNLECHRHKPTPNTNNTNVIRTPRIKR